MVNKFLSNQILFGYWNIFHRLRGQEELDRANFRLKSTDTDDVRSRKSSTGNFLTRRLKDIQFVFHNPTSGPFIWVQYPTMYGAIALPPPRVFWTLNNVLESLFTRTVSVSVTVSVKFTLCQWRWTVWFCRMGTEPILPIKRSVSIDTMINFDGDRDGHGNGDGTCK